jgi:serine/threonine-protein kinase TNNI3K
MPYSLCELAHYPHKYTPALRFTIIHGIAQGLAYLHRNNILHRDIKPENVLLDRNKNIKLCDFGLSIKLKAEKYFSQIIEGTSRYIAPEIYQDLCYSRKSDIYSFAVVVWELTASKNYLDSLPEKELITKVMAGYREEIPQDDLKIAGLIKWCWQQEPERRPTADAIVGYLDGKDTEPLSSFCSIP